MKHIEQFHEFVTNYKKSGSKDNFIRDMVRGLGEAIDSERYKGARGSSQFGHVLQGHALEMIYGKQTQ